MKRFLLETNLLPEQIGIFYLGQTGYLLKYRDKYIMIDGYLSDYVDQNCSNEMVKWIRNYPPPILPGELDFVDYVFCTHSHFDHADPDTLAPLAKVNKKAKFFIPAAILETVAGYGIPKERLFPLHHNETAELDRDIHVTAIKAAHEEFHTDNLGNYHELGYKLHLGDTRIFHAGDGCPYDGLEETINDCDILMLPINGRDYYRTNVLDIIGCFTCQEAVILAKNTGADFLIPTHYDLYDVNCINPACFVEEIQKINSAQKFHLFTPGERYIYSK